MWGKSSLRVEGGAQELVLSYSLRHRMLYFLQNLLYYISYEVLEPRWHKLMQQLAHPSVKTVDDVRNLHMSFLSTVLKESLLTYGPLYKKLYQLISECAAFADRVQGTYLLNSLLPYLLTYLLTYLRPYLCPYLLIQGTSPSLRTGGDDEYTLFIQRSSVAFDAHLLRFMDALRDNAHAEYHVQLKALVARLNYNGFYSRRLEVP